MDWSALERCIRQDPGRRGLASALDRGQPIAVGHLARAVGRIAATLPHRPAAAIVTGFWVADAEPPAPETDGPPGAAYLAAALAACGVDTHVLSDARNFGLVRLSERENTSGFAWRAVAIPANSAVEFDRWVDEYLDQRMAAADSLLLVAIERVGPCHTPDSATRGAVDPEATREAFLRVAPAEHWNRCHNMRGAIIDASTAPAHRLFERAQERCLPAHSVGIADGGNEIGCGAIPWATLVAATTRMAATACRVACDDLILAGVSNWGAYALAEALLATAGPRDLAQRWPPAQRFSEQRALIEHMAAHGAIDGVTRRAEPTVDGLPLDEALAPLERLQQLAQSDPPLATGG